MLVQSDPLPPAAPLEGFLATSIFNQDSAHGLGRGSEEVAAAVPALDLVHVYEAKVGFMDQCRRLERLARFFLSQLRRRQLAQLVIDQGQELLCGGRIALDGG